VDPAGVRGWFSAAYARERTTVFAAAFDPNQAMVAAIMSRRYEALGQLGLMPEHLDLFSLLHYVAVDSRWRGHGVGKALIDLTRARLKETGVRWWIGGAESADAAGFFAASGFIVEASRSNLALFGDNGPKLRSERPGYRWFHQLL
jgi:GNAT superfamily N-acetyltransferase